MIDISIEKRLNAHNGQEKLQINTNIEHGSITAISGPSGAGKTTFLKIIAGFTRPDKGMIKYQEEVWVDVTNDVFVPVQQRHIGFAFQHYALFPNMSVKEHLQYATKDTRWIVRLLEIGQLASFANVKPEYLSGGQQQRLSVLRAMATRPRLLLLDEPFSALDNTIKTKLIDDLKLAWNEFEPTVFIVTHSLSELNGLVTNALCIN